MDVLEEIRFGHLFRVLTTLLEYERKGYEPSLTEIISKAGISESAFYVRVKDKLIKAGLVEERTIHPRIKTLKLTEKGRQLAECLIQCKNLFHYE
ncbi:MAG: hypothetical protein GSR84_09020 [Desulfurococcales archaeon]|nr:hypothetical protein [Desulfurococcales archaeon]